MAPLFYRHARAAGLSVPNEARLQLQGLTLRHQKASEVRTSVLCEILRACKESGIEVVLLKGAALAYLIYAPSGLRPMRDLDLLVRADQTEAMQQRLFQLGFQIPAEAHTQPASLHHLAEMAKTIDGFKITVEIHHQVFDPIWRCGLPPIDQWMDRARPLWIHEQPATSLNLEDMLCHLYQHMINGEMKLISIADFISLAEQFADEICWEKIRQETPGVIAALALFHTVSALDSRLIERTGIKHSRRKLLIDKDLSGWPRLAADQASRIGLKKFLRETLLPSEWWLRLYFGVAPDRPILPYRLLYPCEVLRILAARLLLRLSSKVSPASASQK